MPLIYVMSWKSCRRFGQAFSETASWVIGYLITTGLLFALHFGGVGMISATPDDPAAVVALLGGFVGMAISRYLWKRRGGHLEPVKVPFSNSRYLRAARAIVGNTKNSSRSAPSPKTPAKQSTTTTVPKPTATASRSAPQRTATGSSKSSAQKWGRVIGAMLTPPDSQRRPPQ